MTNNNRYTVGRTPFKVDVLLLTVTKVEAQTVLKLFQKEVGQPFQSFFLGDKTYFDLGALNGAHIVMVQSDMGSIGPGGALLVVDEAIRELSPSAIIMVGIAFGIDDKKQHIGDILVSQQLLGYEQKKVKSNDSGEDEIIARGDRPHASIRLLDRFRSGALDWQGPDVEFGLLLSGEKLIESSHFREQLLKLAPEAIGGEMEGTGLYSSASRRKVDCIVVKSICAWSLDTNKHA